MTDQTPEITQLRQRCEQLQNESAVAQEALANLKAELRDLAAEAGSGKTTAVLIAEHQSILEQYAYRDRLLVQEFYFAIAASGLAMTLVTADVQPEIGVLVCVGMVLLNAGLWVHIGHLRMDRDLMWTEALRLEARLDMQVLRRIFEAGYANEQSRRSVSGTWLMVSTVGAFSLFWVLALGHFLWSIDFSTYAFWWQPHR